MGKKKINDPEGNERVRKVKDLPDSVRVDSDTLSLHVISKLRDVAGRSLCLDGMSSRIGRLLRPALEGKGRERKGKVHKQVTVYQISRIELKSASGLQDLDAETSDAKGGEEDVRE